MISMIVDLFKRWISWEIKWISEVTQTFGEQFNELCSKLAWTWRTSSTISDIQKLSERNWLQTVSLSINNKYTVSINEICIILEGTDEPDYHQISIKLMNLENLVKEYKEPRNQFKSISESL